MRGQLGSALPAECRFKLQTAGSHCTTYTSARRWQKARRSRAHFNFLSDRAVGDTAAVKTIYRFRFKQDGTFETCKSLLTVVPAVPTIQRTYESKTGNYEVDGYKIHLTYNEGGEDLYPFFFDPARPSRLWLGFNYYPTPTNDVPEICMVP